MDNISQDDITLRERRRNFSEVRPRVYEDAGRLTLQFQFGEVQSQMLVSDPNFLLLPYTRTMMAFMLFNSEPRSITMVGLGGGSIAKWCYLHIPAAAITIVEINPMVISLRERFCIPPDDHRFHVIQGDGADYLSANPDPPDVLLVDGFDLQGQPAQLSSQRFYDDCYHALGSDGLLVVNLCSRMEQKSISRIERSFDDRVLVVIPEDGENKVVFAVKGERLWMKQEPAGALVSKLRACSRKQSFLR